MTQKTLKDLRLPSLGVDKFGGCGSPFVIIRTAQGPL